MSQSRWVGEWLIGWVGEWVDGQASEFSEWVGERVGELLMSGWVSGWVGVDELVSEWGWVGGDRVSEIVSELDSQWVMWVGGQASEWIQWVSGWVGVCMSESVSDEWVSG